MGGRPAKPVQLHLLNGNKRHLTKEEIEERREQEAKLRSGQREFKASAQVRNSKQARAMFNKLKKLYKEIEFVEGLDENIINRYCLAHAEHIELLDMRQELSDRFFNSEGPVEQLSIPDKINELDKRIEKKRDTLLKIEDRLFLNPTARIKNVPAKKGKEKKDPHADMFGD